MAETTKTKAQLIEENEALNKSLSDLEAQMKILMDKVNILSQMPMANVAPKLDVTSRKVDVISLCANPAHLSTERYGGGVSYDFNGYGTVRKIKFSDLEKIVHTTKNVAADTGTEKSFFERGIFYICDAEVVEELGLESYYEEILDKSKVDEMIELKSTTAINIFKGANTAIREEVVRMIIDNYVNGKEYDRNYISMLSNEYGSDIMEKAEAMKRALSKNDK